MKDLFLPIILFVVTITAGVVFLRGIYKPQKDTLAIIAENEYRSQVAVSKLVDGTGEVVSGMIVKSTIDYYSMDSSKDVVVYNKQGDTAIYTTNKSDQSADKGTSFVIHAQERYQKEIVRSKDTGRICEIRFVMQ